MALFIAASDFFARFSFFQNLNTTVLTPDAELDSIKSKLGEVEDEIKDFDEKQVIFTIDVEELQD